jgi:acetyl-CoA C-acetyltransferase
MSGLRGDAAIVGMAEWKPEKRPTLPPSLGIEQWAQLSKAALDDAGLTGDDVDGMVTGGIPESARFAPATVAEYLGIEVGFAEFVDLGGATSAGMIWRAAAAIELGIANVVVCTVPARPTPSRSTGGVPNIRRFGASSELYGSPQAEFDIPFGNVAQNAPYAMIANRYAAEYGYDAEALAKIAVDQRTNACANPDAVFYGKPITIEDVLASPIICDPIHMLEAVMRVSGGASVVLASREVAERTRNRPVWVTGFGERLAYKTPTYAKDLLQTPIGPASDQAFDMAGVSRDEIDMVSIYDCYTITVLMSLEDAGFCKKGTGAEFVKSHDLTYRGDFPCNTHGGQLSFGQAASAGGMSHVCDGARQIMGRAGESQVADCNVAFVSGNGGIMSEQVALILKGD